MRWLIKVVKILKFVMKLGARFKTKSDFVQLKNSDFYVSKYYMAISFGLTSECE